MAIGADLAKKSGPIRMIRQILVWGILLYFRLIARIALSQFHGTSIGVAGSIGKSSTRNALSTILSGVAPTIVASGNSETGIPLGLVGLTPLDYGFADWLRLILQAPLRIFFLKQYTYLIVEMGIDDPNPPKNMGYLLSIIQPEIGIITHESAAHTEQFEKTLSGQSFSSPQEKRDALIAKITEEDGRMLLTNSTRVAILNMGNPFIKNWAQTHSSQLAGKLHTFGTSRPDDVVCLDYFVDIKGTKFSFTITTDTTEEMVELHFKGHVFPRELASVFAPTFLVAHHLGVSFLHVKHTLEASYHPPKGRESIFQGIQGMTIIDSSYNASKPSVIALLDVLKALKKDTKRETVVILADMLELGDSAKSEHEEVAEYLKSAADSVFLIGPLTQAYILPYLQKYPDTLKTFKWFSSSFELDTYLQTHLPKNSIVLFKGSQGNLWLEEYIKKILKNKEDIQLLCRQDAYWSKIKKKAGRWV